jgi:hypothetical protein
MAGKITWDQDGIEEIKQICGELCDSKAEEVIAAAAPPVDTGFLQASGYVNSYRVNTFARTWETGVYTGKSGDRQARERVEEPEEPPDEYGAVMGWAAIYAWEIEDTQTFIYPALLSVAEG